MNYKQFRTDNNIETKTMIAVIQEFAPSYTKIQQSMVDAPEKYGICLTPYIEQQVKERLSPPMQPKHKPPKQK